MKSLSWSWIWRGWIVVGLLALPACRAANAGPEPITGSGTLEGREVALASELGGRIVALSVDEGDTVTVGQVLVQLDDAQAHAQVSQARAAVAAAEANVARLEAGPRPQEVEAAQAQVREAEAEATGAERAVIHAQESITHPLELELQITQARMALQLAEQGVQSAQADLAAEQLWYHIYIELPENVSDDTRRIWELRIQARQQAVVAAQAQRDAAQADLNALYTIRANPLTAEAEFQAAQAVYTVTLAGVEVAQAQLAQLQSGSRPEELTIARAQWDQARAGLALALTQQELLTLTAPITGVVAMRSFHVGEMASPGLPILTLVNLDTVYLTLYVPQDVIGQVRSGQRVEVTVDAYPDTIFTGAVEQIASEAEFTPRNVQTAEDRARLVFAVRVELPNADHRLRPGMPAEGVILP